MAGDLFGCVCVKRSQDWQEGVTLGWDMRFMRRDEGEGCQWWITDGVVVEGKVWLAAG